MSRAATEIDELLTRSEVARVLKISPRSVSAYASRWPSLVRGRRELRIRATGRPMVRWTRSSLERHIRVELAADAVRGER